MLEDFENIELLSVPKQEGLSPFQMDYLSELEVSDLDWAECNEGQQLVTLSLIDGRMDEIGVSFDERSDLAHQIYSIDMAEAYDDYLESYKIEAPQDHIQIEQICDLISDCDGIKYENWVNLELLEKETILNSLEEHIAEIECRPACAIHLTPLKENQWGGYNPVTKDITINSTYAELSDYHTYREVMDTVIHEGRHAYQDYNVNVCEIHPRHSEVKSWSENMEGGKWEYWGDCSSLLGQRLYEQQSIEIDARNFAADVLERLNLKA